jgi:hypothetical protein
VVFEPRHFWAFRPSNASPQESARTLGALKLGEGLLLWHFRKSIETYWHVV